jgi:hypothetical protein
MWRSRQLPAEDSLEMALSFAQAAHTSPVCLSMPEQFDMAFESHDAESKVLCYAQQRPANPDRTGIPPSRAFHFPWLIIR